LNSSRKLGQEIPQSYKPEPPFTTIRYNDPKWHSPLPPVGTKRVTNPNGKVGYIDAYRDTHRHEKIRQEFTAFLEEWPWDFFLTFTTKHEHTESWYQHNIEGFFRYAQYKDGRYDTGRHIWVCEYGRKGGRLHGHAVVRGELDLVRAQELWRGRGRYQQSRIREGVTPAYYLTKYLTKSTAVWGLGGWRDI